MHDILSQNRSPCSLYDIEITVRSPYPIVRAAAEKFHLPVPKISILNTPLDNAAATGISYGRSSISITAGGLLGPAPAKLTSPIILHPGHAKKRAPPLPFFLTTAPSFSWAYPPAPPPAHLV